MKTNALLIFTRNPQLGKVKTRLAKTIGDEKALEIYNDLLHHTMTETHNLKCDKFVFYDENIELNDVWPINFYEKKLQFGTDLGAKMQNAFQHIFDLGYKNCVIIGSDLFDLEATYINLAFEKLESNEVAIGPAEDGGYYLLGLKKVIPTIFKNKNWGTNTVLKETLKDLKNHTTVLLKTLNDIDTYEDLQKSNYYKSQKSS